MSSSSRPLSIEEFRTAIINLTRYFDNNVEKYNTLNSYCKELLVLINASKRTTTTYSFEDYLKTCSENTIKFIANKLTADSCYQKLIDLKQFDENNYSNFLQTITTAVSAYHVCVELTRQNNFLEIRTLVTLRELFLERIIHLEVLNRNYFINYYNIAGRKNLTSMAKDFLNRVIASNDIILDCINRLESAKFIKEKNDTTTLQTNCGTALFRINRPFTEIGPELIAPKYSYEEPAAPSEDSLDKLINTMSITNKPPSKK
jgi:hypothetical protein